MPASRLSGRLLPRLSRKLVENLIHGTAQSLLGLLQTTADAGHRVQAIRDVWKDGLGIPLDMKVKGPTAMLAIFVAVILGVISGYLPARRASRMNIVEGLRHIG